MDNNSIIELLSVPLSDNTTLHVCYGSILDYSGDVIVNAANEGCTGGFGVDEAINKAGGFQLKLARKELNGCKTGNAKITKSYEHNKVKWIIHAVGPVYRKPFNQEISKNYFTDKDILLQSAYTNSLNIAEEYQCSNIGFCLLCAGVFRGERSLAEILEISLKTISSFSYCNLKDITIIAYTNEEKEVLEKVAKNMFGDM